MSRDRVRRTREARATFAAHDRAWKLDRALAQARDRARALLFALALRLEPNLTLDLDDIEVVGDLHHALRRPLAFDVEFALHAGRDRDTKTLRLDIAREVDRVQSLDRAIGVVRDVARSCPRAVGRRRARALERSLRRARSRSRGLDRALHAVHDEITLSRTQGMPAEAPLLRWMARLLPPEARARFIEEQAASLAWSQGAERARYVRGLVLGMPRYVWTVRRGQHPPGAPIDDS